MTYEYTAQIVNMGITNLRILMYMFTPDKIMGLRRHSGSFQLVTTRIDVAIQIATKFREGNTPNNFLFILFQAKKYCERLLRKCSDRKNASLIAKQFLIIRRTRYLWADIFI